MVKNVTKLWKNKPMRFLALGSSVVIIIAVFIGAISSYLQKFERTMTQETESYLSEITEHIIANIQTVVRDTEKMLEISGVKISGFEDQIELIGYMEKIENEYDFEYVGCAAADGLLTATMESESVNIGGAEYFLKALNGESVVQYVPRKIFEDRAISGILFAAPIYGNEGSTEQPTGVLVAMLDVAKLEDIMNIEMFGGSGYNYIIDMHGEIIMGTKSVDYSNLYRVLKHCDFAYNNLNHVIQEVSEQEEGFAIYSDLGVEKYMYYQFLGIDAWSVVTMVEKQAIAAKTTQLINDLMVLGVTVMILFPVLVIFVFAAYGTSQKRKLAADAKSAFLANMSHEIRTPMNAVVGISEILLREPLNAKQRNYVLSIVNAGNGLITIINDILDLSKIESGKFGIIEDEYELESLVYDVTTIISIRIGEKPIEFLIDLDVSLPKYLVGDMMRIKQVLINILGNAVKFTSSGYIKLRIDGEILDGVMRLVMTVEDTGVGIHKKDLEWLFISFNQVDTHKSHSVEGTGLGLVISKRLCEMMGGGITVESVYGQGSTFTITINQVIERSEKLLYIPKPENFRLLILEESAILREYFSSCMDKMKLEYYICAESAACVEKMNRGGYTHVLSKYPAIRQLADVCKNRKKLRFVTLLDLKEQALLHGGNLNVYIPLFTLQLAAVLYERVGHAYLLNRSGMDNMAMQPMPFVNILLVDDNEVNLQVASGLMTPYHMNVDCALSGRRAIEMIEKKEYDLVFMDHMMPEMDGVEAVKIIRTLPDEKKRTIPIIALTANVAYDAKSMFQEAGFDDVLAKPVETVKLNEILKKWMKDINAAREEQNPEQAEIFRKNMKNEQESDNVGALELMVTDYVDFNDGIKRLGSMEVYRDILSTYYASVIAKMRELPGLFDSDMQRFIIEVHGIKGASGGISSHRIAAMAEELEQWGKAGDARSIKSELPVFLDELERSMKEIALFIDKYAVQESAPDEKQRVGTMEEETLVGLENAFLDFDTERIGILLAMQQDFVWQGREKTLIEKLTECYNRYDFDLPVQLIQDYRENKKEKA